MAEKDKTSFVVEDKIFKNGVRYYCVYNYDKTKLLLLCKCVKFVSSFIGKKHGYWGVNR